MRAGRQTLVFDADDTLWENNVLFERVADAFIEWLAHPTLDRQAAREALNDVERANVVVHGYGSASFLRSLHDCAARLRNRRPSEAELAEIAELAAVLADHEVQLVPGVAETLADLGDRHELLLLTKGDPAEQQRKIDASELAHHFRSLHIVAEKHVGTYHRLVAEQDLRPESTWMIGNSPRSDILPARAAGLNAVYIPHEFTWALEHDEVPADDRVLTLTRFTELPEHF